MNGFLLDTNVISELIKPQPDENVLRWIAETDETLLFLSVLTLAEIRYGIEKLNPGKRRGRGLRRLASPVSGADFDPRRGDCGTMGCAVCTAARRGRPVPVIDGLLAATALHDDLMLVTRDDGDVSGTAVPLLDPWQ